MTFSFKNSINKHSGEKPIGKKLKKILNILRLYNKVYIRDEKTMTLKLNHQSSPFWIQTLGDKKTTTDKQNERYFDSNN